ALSSAVGADVHIKVEGQNPTGSFKDRGMASAMSKALNDGASTVVCASTGNTSASAAAYAATAGLTCVVLLPQGKIAAGKLAQARAPDTHILPVGNAGNISAYWMAYQEYRDAGVTAQLPAMWGFQAERAAPFVAGRPIPDPETVATAIRIGAPASWNLAVAARDDSGGLIDAVSDEQILDAQKRLAADVGIFVEPASAAGVAGLLQQAGHGRVPEDATITVTVTGNGLKDIDTALSQHDLTPTVIEADIAAAAQAMGL